MARDTWQEDSGFLLLDQIRLGGFYFLKVLEEGKEGNEGNEGKEGKEEEVLVVSVVFTTDFISTSTSIVERHGS